MGLLPDPDDPGAEKRLRRNATLLCLWRNASLSCQWRKLHFHASAETLHFQCLSLRFELRKHGPFPRQAFGGLQMSEIPSVIWDGTKCTFGITSETLPGEAARPL